MSKHLMVKALAGTGKTTTMVWAVGSVPKGITLSNEQVAICDWFRQQKIQKYRFLAFNKSIASELASRVPAYCEAATCHSSGLSIIKANHGRRIKVDGWKYRKIMDRLFGEPKKSEDYQARAALSTLIDVARANMLGADNGKGILELTNDDVITLRGQYDINSPLANDQMLDLANRALREGSNDFQVVDFADMIWMPAFHEMKCSKVGGLIVDECQDLNAAQQKLVAMQGHQIICVGDVNQAIYGFAGADSQSMENLENMLRDNGGVDVKPLTVTRRCGKAIVELANRLVPEYRAADENGDGAIEEAKLDKIGETLKEKSGEKKDVMVLCRTNAPLVGLAFNLMKNEVPVIIRGRDIGQGIIKLIEKISGKSNDIDALVSGIQAWSLKEEDKIRKRTRYGVDEKLMLLNDKVSCILVLSDDCETVTDLVNKLENLFQDRNGKPGTIVLSSVHKAKGLEADTVYIYRPDLLPHPKLIEKSMGQQEFNLEYVAYTRAINTLVFVRPTA